MGQEGAAKVGSEKNAKWQKRGHSQKALLDAISPVAVHLSYQL